MSTEFSKLPAVRRNKVLSDSPDSHVFRLIREGHHDAADRFLDLLPLFDSACAAVDAIETQAALQRARDAEHQSLVALAGFGGGMVEVEI